MGIKELLPLQLQESAPVRMAGLPRASVSLCVLRHEAQACSEGQGENKWPRSPALLHEQRGPRPLGKGHEITPGITSSGLSSHPMQSSRPAPRLSQEER